MASETRSQTELEWLDSLRCEPGRFDFYVAMRRLECIYADLPRWGDALHAHDERIRFGQLPGLKFEPSSVTSFRPATEERCGQLAVSFFGLFGPQGPLPLHLTEFARERTRRKDGAFEAFANLFHHRLLQLYYRTWANTQPTVGEDRRDGSFANYLATFTGLGFPSLRERDVIPDTSKLQFAGWLTGATRNAEGLEHIVESYFALPARVNEFCGAWLELPTEDRWHLGSSRQKALLGKTTVVGARVWSVAQKFRLDLGPMPHRQLRRFLPGGDWLPQLKTLVQAYLVDNLDWDVRLIPKDQTVPLLLDGTQRLGHGLRVGRGTLSACKQDVVVHPETNRVSRTDSLSRTEPLSKR